MMRDIILYWYKNIKILYYNWGEIVFITDRTRRWISTKVCILYDSQSLIVNFIVTYCYNCNAFVSAVSRSTVKLIFI